MTNSTDQLPGEPPIEVPRIFIAYSHKDSVHAVALKKHLRPIELDGKAIVFYDGVIEIGKPWQSKLLLELESANIVVLLLSPDFFDSEYIHKIELNRMFSRVSAGENIFVIPVLVRYCNPTDKIAEYIYIKFDDLPQSEGTSKPVPLDEVRSSDLAWTTVAKEIERKTKQVAALLYAKATFSSNTAALPSPVLPPKGTHNLLSNIRGGPFALCSRTGIGWRRAARHLFSVTATNRWDVNFVFLDPNSEAFRFDSQMQWKARQWGAVDAVQRRILAIEFYNTLSDSGFNVHVTSVMLPAVFWILPGEHANGEAVLLEVPMWKADDDGNFYLYRQGEKYTQTYRDIFESICRGASRWEPQCP